MVQEKQQAFRNVVFQDVHQILELLESKCFKSHFSKLLRDMTRSFL